MRHVEAERQREMAKQVSCECGGLPFKHRQGSHFTCIHHPDVDKPWTEEQMHDWEAMQRTPRSG